MNRILAAYAILSGRGEAVDVATLRRRVDALSAEITELEISITSIMEKLSTMAARFRRRESRAAAKLQEEQEQEQPPTPQIGPNGDGKAALRRRAAQMRGVRR